MTMTEQIRDELKRKKKGATPKDDLLNAFNEASSILLKDYIEDVMAGHKKIEDTTELYRIFNMFMQINGLNEGVAGEGSLPSMSNEQKALFATAVKVHEGGEDEEDIEYIDEEEMANYTSEDIQKMIAEREQQMNEENEGRG